MEYLILSLFTILLYVQSLNYGYVVDDINQVTQMGKWRKANMRKFRQHWLYGAGMFRTAQTDHAFRIMMNVILACSICYAFNPWAAALYIASPANNQITLWLNGRRYQSSMILGVLSYAFPLLGVLAFPLAFWLHPMILPMAGIKLLSSPLALLWFALGAIAIPKIHKWYKSRMKNKPYENYRKFHPRNLILGINNLAEYWTNALIPTGFTMYHATQWGSMSSDMHKERCYKINAHFFQSIAVLITVHTVPCLLNQEWIKWALFADASIFMWLAIFRMHGQVWSQRYATLFNLFVYVGLSLILSNYLVSLAIVAFAVITLKDMNMYKNYVHFFMRHIVNNPHNYQVTCMAVNQFEEHVNRLNKQGKPFHSLIYYFAQNSAELLWCLNNHSPCKIQEKFYDKMKAILKNEMDIAKKKGGE